MSLEDYELAKELVETVLGRDATPEEIEQRMADLEAERIDAAYEQARADELIDFENNCLK